MSAITPMQVFCIPQPGKPDPNADYTLGNARPRVPQSRQKGDTCWYYGLNLIRERYGKTAPPTLQGRVTEKTLSNLRKQLTRLSNEEGLIRNAQSVLKIHPLKDSTVSGVRLYINYLHIVCTSQGTPDKVRAAVGPVIQLLEEFCQQKEVKRFEDYLGNKEEKILQSKIATLESYLKGLGLNPREEVEKYWQFAWRSMTCARVYLDCQKTGTNLNGIEKEFEIQRRLAVRPKDVMTIAKYAGRLSTVVELNAARKLGLRYADWDPCQPFDNLARSLKDHGPHYVGGAFGETFYKAPPDVLQDKAEGRAVYGWKKDAARVEINSEFKDTLHIAVVVGATKTSDGKEYVFYVDPQNASDPKDINSQRVYKVSYARFKELMSSLESVYGVISKDLSSGEDKWMTIGDKVPSRETGLHYALYASSKPDLSADSK